MTWWCAALGEPWSWTWRAYPGVWLFIFGIAAAYGAGAVRGRSAGEAIARRDIALFATGLGVLWLGADWPLGTLAAGYLLSARIVQYVLFVLVAPPLILLGIPRWMWRRILRRPAAAWLARLLVRPLIPLIVYNAVLVAAHLPSVIDGLGGSPWGAFALDLSMIVSGLVFWWPALGRLPELEPMGYGGRIGYLLLSVFVPTVPGAFYTFARYPIYGLYELAPRVYDIPAVADQQVAGLIMKLGGGFILFGTMSVMFFRWFAREEATEITETEVV
ncbi:MAG TPA: cytochrome c oxidase assembly protein [Gemmatimonadales bacterium]